MYLTRKKTAKVVDVVDRVNNMEEATKCASTFGMEVSEVVFCELNRTGVWLELNQVPVRFRVRFLCDEIFSEKPPMYFAVPVKRWYDTKFSIDKEDNLTFSGVPLGKTTNLEIDTCDCSYFRKDKKVLNLNSNSRGDCGGCSFCIHNYAIYDERVLKDTEKMLSKESLRGFLEDKIMAKNGFKDISHLEQIAVVTGLFTKEEKVVQHIADIREVGSQLGFSGPIFFLGCELISRDALKELKNRQPFSFCYSVDCLENRERNLVAKKGKVPIASIMQILECALEYGFEATFSYIVGLDTFQGMSKGIIELSRYVNRFPIVNIYQTQDPNQRKIMTPEAYHLEYFLRARKMFEEVFKNTGLRPHNWENYRSLWYHWFGQDEFLPG